MIVKLSGTEADAFSLGPGESCRFFNEGVQIEVCRRVIVTINGTKFQVKLQISYEEIVALADPDGKDERMLTVIVKPKSGVIAACSLTPGQTCEVGEGTRIDVVFTGNA